MTRTLIKSRYKNKLKPTIDDKTTSSLPQIYNYSKINCYQVVVFQSINEH